MLRLPKNPDTGEGSCRRAEGPDGVIYFIMTCTRDPRAKVMLFTVVPYNARVRATPCQTLSLINEPRQKDCARETLYDINVVHTTSSVLCVCVFFFFFLLSLFICSSRSRMAYRSSRRDNNINGVFLIKTNIPVESSPS
jgi:hypothetical protein